MDREEKTAHHQSQSNELAGGNICARMRDNAHPNFLRGAFLYMSISATWQPLSFESDRLLKSLYTLYQSIALVSMLVTLTLMGVALLLNAKSMRDFAEIGFVFMTGCSALVKGVNIITRRRCLEKLRAMFLEEICLKADADEREICGWYRWLGRYLVIVTMLIAEFTALSVVARPLPWFLVNGELDMPVRAWYPFDVPRGNGSLRFVVYAHQAVNFFVLTSWNSTSDIILCSFMVQLCVQFHLLSHRLRRLPTRVAELFGDEGVAVALGKRKEMNERRRRYEAAVIRRCVQQHLHIFKLVDQLKICFNPNILSQFSLCGIILCLTIYQLALEQPDIANFALLCVYLNTMLIELLLYCWFGNEVVVKSSRFNDDIFEMDWSSLQLRTQKELLFIMQRASEPIQITCGPFVRLSTDAYITILKFSYSMYNVLRGDSSY